MIKPLPSMGRGWGGVTSPDKSLLSSTITPTLPSPIKGEGKAKIARRPVSRVLSSAVAEAKADVRPFV